MKRLIIAIAIILTIATLGATDTNAETHVVVKAGADFGGKLKASAFSTSSESKGASCFPLNIELMRDVNKKLALGGGFEYQVRHSDFDFSPIGYGLVRYFPKPDFTKNKNFYLIAKAGHNSFHADDVNTGGGSYRGFGVGFVKTNGAILEILYSIHHGLVYEYLLGYRYEIEAKYSKFSISFGFLL